jgi:hypothetical protein
MALKEKLDAIRKASSKRIPPDRIGWNLVRSIGSVDRNRVSRPRGASPYDTSWTQTVFNGLLIAMQKKPTSPCCGSPPHHHRAAVTAQPRRADTRLARRICLKARDHINRRGRPRPTVDAPTPRAMS